MSYRCINIPAKWVSAHRKNEYKIRLPQSTINSGYNSGGYLKVILAGAFPNALNVGDRIYIPAGTDYTGFHTIKSIDSSIQFTLETAYISNIGGSVVVWQVYLPTVEIWKGYRDGEIVLTWTGGTIDLYDIMPYELVGTFQPEAGFDGYLTFDICGYLKTVIETPYKAAYSPDEESFLYVRNATEIYTPKYYNRVEVVLNDGLIRTHYVANAGITTDELNRGFVDTGRQMQPLLVPVDYFGDFKLGDFINGNLLTAKYT